MALRLAWGTGLASVFAICNALAGTPYDCAVHSPRHRVTVLELYTSEGCNSCPPADRWLSGLPQRGVSPQNAVVLAFHVDYWNQLGWPDRFSQPAFSQRQRDYSKRQPGGAIYTPQVMLDGTELRGAYYKPQQLQKRLATINGEPAGASIRAQTRHEGNDLKVSGETRLADAALWQRTQTWIAVYESGLSSQVKTGENAGLRLVHDFVVHELAGPMRAAQDGRTGIERSIRLSPDWRTEQLGIAVFVQREDTGQVLQAIALPLRCPS